MWDVVFGLFLIELRMIKCSAEENCNMTLTLLFVLVCRLSLDLRFIFHLMVCIYVASASEFINATL